MAKRKKQNDYIFSNSLPVPTFFSDIFRHSFAKKGAVRRLHPFFTTSNIFILFIIAFLKITQKAISLQKVHLWMEISADCPNRGRRSLTKMDRPGNVQSSVWTLQQILPDRLPFDSVYNSFSPNHSEGNR